MNCISPWAFFGLVSHGRNRVSLYAIVHRMSGSTPSLFAALSIVASNNLARESTSIFPSEVRETNSFSCAVAAKGKPAKISKNNVIGCVIRFFISPVLRNRCATHVPPMCHRCRSTNGTNLAERVKVLMYPLPFSGFVNENLKSEDDYEKTTDTY